MISDEELLDLPEDPELAFVQSERKLRENLFKNLRDSEGYEIATYKPEYINLVVGIAKALDLSVFDGYNIPEVDHHIDSTYMQFLHDVDHYTVQIRMRDAKRVRRYSVALDNVTKSKIRHHLEQIKDIVDRLEVSDRKREALYSKINVLADEVDRDRTRFDAAMALVLEVASTGGEATDKLEPARKWINSISRLLGRAKEAEDTAIPSLPAPKERKRIEPPRRTPPDKKSSPTFDDLDDEIPFWIGTRIREHHVFAVQRPIRMGYGLRLSGASRSLKIRAVDARLIKAIGQPPTSARSGVDHRRGGEISG